MKTDFRPDPELFPFESRFFESSVGPIHYVDEGQGLPITFFHGNPTWSFLYRDVIKGLKDSFRCVAFDYPGFGLSVHPVNYGFTPSEHARVMEELIDHLDLDQFIVMGQDWGGPIGLKVACDRAERVRGVVLGNTWFWPADRTMTKFFSKIMSSGFMQKKIVNKNFFVERLYPMGHANKPSGRELEQYRSVYPTPESRAGIAQFPREILASHELLAELARAVPERLADKRALLVWGMKDFAFPPKATIPRMKETFSDLEIVELPRASHFIQEDAPQEIVAAIKSRFA
jgi:haloalkane dehalogenase